MEGGISTSPSSLRLILDDLRFFLFPSLLVSFRKNKHNPSQVNPWYLRTDWLDDAVRFALDIWTLGMSHRYA